MVIVWTADWDNKLLVAIWETCGTKFDWESTAEILGGTCTPEAIMQHLRTLTKKAEERRRQQRKTLLEAHAARAASVAKGKAKRKWGYNRTAQKRIEEMDQYDDEDEASADNKTKTSSKRYSKNSRSTESVLIDDSRATDGTRYRNSSQQTAEKNNNRQADHWYNDNTGEKSTKGRVDDENRDKSRRRGSFWNKYVRDDRE
ncbi:hypothetical protein PEBR_08801 [Penicillium brasilianum]|uniref:Uncharacterized protein n=1 Tax=Penicillium brasilianum TaxID=104259 RepID=A0A1S9S1F5_PENBI|nr:hypothetical protein PEBR_08801 [Penicillium brasilianum]